RRPASSTVGSSRARDGIDQRGSELGGGDALSSCMEICRVWLPPSLHREKRSENEFPRQTRLTSTITRDCWIQFKRAHADSESGTEPCVAELSCLPRSAIMSLTRSARSVRSPVSRRCPMRRKHCSAYRSNNTPARLRCEARTSADRFRLAREGLDGAERHT